MASAGSAEDEFRVMANVAPVLIWRSGADKGCDFFNDTWLRFTGRRLEEELGWGWAEGVHPDDAERCLAVYDRAFETRAEFEMEYRLRRHDGSYRLVLDRGAPLLRDQQFAGFVGACTDITEQRAAEVARRRIENRLLTIIEALDEGVVAHSPLDGSGFANAAFIRMFGGSDTAGAVFENGAEGLGHHELLDAQHRVIPAADRPLRRVLRGERVESQSTRARFSDGRILDLVYRGEPIFDEAGRVKLAILVIRDVSAQKQAAVELQSLQHELIHVARVSAMGSLASTLAHELNQPLTAIVNYAASARRVAARCDVPAIRPIDDLLERATQSAQAAGEIVRRLRDMVHKTEPRRVSQPIREIIHNAVNLTLADPVQRSLLRLRVQADVDRVVADRVQIQQVLVNLIRNALEAMEKSATRRLDVEVVRRDDGMAVVSVADTGPGIPDDVKRHLFMPFVSSKTGGMGLGLSICRTIVEAHGGELLAEVREGGGTVFRFSLPAAGSSEQEVPRPMRDLPTP